MPVQRSGELRPASAHRIDAVDGLRAVAMTMVVAGHCYLIPVGWMGVWLFYSISGYVIMRGFVPRLGAREQPPLVRYVGFLQRRFWRIVPAYVVYVALNVAVGIAAHAPASWEPLPSLLSFTYNWRLVFEDESATQWFPFLHLWTLSVEQQFYLVFPLLVIGLSGERHGKAMLWLAAFAFVCRAGLGVTLEAVEGSDRWKSLVVYLSSMCHLDAFIAGALIAHIEAHSDRLGRVKLRAQLGVVALLAAAAYVVGYGVLGVQRAGFGFAALHGIFWGNLYGERRELFVYSVVTLASAWCLLAVLSRCGASVLAHPWVCRVGRISYGGYLFHALVLWALATSIGADATRMNALPLAERVLLFIATMAITLVAADLSFRFLEEPIRRRFAPSRGGVHR